jgi:hypothetical protein
MIVYYFILFICNYSKVNIKVDRSLSLYFLQPDSTKLEQKEVLKELAAYDSVIARFVRRTLK